MPPHRPSLVHLVRRLLSAIAAVILFSWIDSRNQNQNSLSVGGVNNSWYMTPSSFNQTWPSIKHALCPAMRPNDRVWSTLFELARSELGFPQNGTLPITKKKEDDKAFRNFFSYQAGGMGYTSPDGLHSVVYLRIKKCGNTNIINSLFGGESTSYGRDMWGFSTLSDLHRRISDSPKNATLCLVTAVRDPVEHFVSAYNEVFDRRAKYTPIKNGTTAHFIQFLRDYVSGPVSNKVYAGKQQTREISHLYAMSGLLWNLGRWKDCLVGNLEEERAPGLTAYLPSLQNLDEEFSRMAWDHCPKGVPLLVPSGKAGKHRSQEDRWGYHATAKEVWKEGGDPSRALCALHALDYACFDAVPVPDVCQKVFTEEVFREKLLRAAASPSGGNQIVDICGSEYLAA